MAGVNVEALIVAWLKAGNVAGGRVSAELPEDPTYPLVTLRGITGAEVVRRRVDDHRIQLDAWADTRPAARTLAQEARDRMEALEGQLVALGFVPEVSILITPRWLPDEETDPPKPRYSADYSVLVHP